MTIFNAPIGIRTSQSLKEQFGAIIHKGNEMTDAKLATGWNVAKIEVSKTEGTGDNKKRVSVGHIKMPYASLLAIKQAVNEATIDAEATANEKENPEGIAIYTHADSAVADVANWVQSAILGKIRIKATNSLINGTNELQNGKSFATSFEELLEPAERGGEYLKLKAEVVTAFAASVKEQGKSDKVVDQWKTLFRFPDVMAQQPAKYKAKMQEYLNAFAGSLSKENLERYGKFLLAVEDACKVVSNEDEMLA